MTYRERREAKADRLRGWADARNQKAEALHARNEPYRGDIAFATQPGRLPERDRVNAREHRAWEHEDRATEMQRRADAIERAAANAIYSDDPDAVEALTAKIARLEAKREQIKAENAAFRKAHKAELVGLTAYGRDRMMPHPGYELTNLSGNISKQRKRLEQLKRAE